MSMMSEQNDHTSDEVNPYVARQIDENLKRLYAESISEDLPESLKSLLDALRQTEVQTKSGEK
jgi:hypothetical protein